MVFYFFVYFLQIVHKVMRHGKDMSKNVHDCYFMDSCACGFETRALPSDSLATTAHFIS